MRSTVAVASVSLMAVAACDSPTAPDGRITTAAQVRDQAATQPPLFHFFSEFGCGPSSDSPNTQCLVQARWGYGWPYSASLTLDVTNDVEWSSGNPNMVMLGRPGELIAVGAGDAEVSTSYRGRRVSMRFRVFGDGDRPRAIAQQSRGRVTTPRPEPPTRFPVVGATIDVIDGRNAGARSTTNADGRFEFTAWVCGPATIRVTNPGYADVVVSRVTCEGNRERDFDEIQIMPIQ